MRDDGSLVRRHGSARRFVLGGGLASLLGLGRTRPAGAVPAWPTRSVRVLMPGAPGGPIDAVMRLVAAEFAAQTGQSMVLDPNPGAGGTRAACLVARARPDGHTLLLGDLCPAALATMFYPGLSFDQATAFTSIGHVVTLPCVLAARHDLDVGDLTSLLAQLQAGRAFAFGSDGIGSASHMAFELLSQHAGIAMRHVPYRGVAELTAALTRGVVCLAFLPYGAASPLVRGGMLRLLAAGPPRGIPALAGLAPVASTVPGFDACMWYGLVGPAGMDEGLVSAVNRCLAMVLAQPDLVAAVSHRQAGRLAMGTPEQFTAMITREAGRWGPLVRARGLGEPVE